MAYAIVRHAKKSNSASAGTNDYNDLQNKPSLNGIELKGDVNLDMSNYYTKAEIDAAIANSVITIQTDKATCQAHSGTQGMDNATGVCIPKGYKPYKAIVCKSHAVAETFTIRTSELRWNKTTNWIYIHGNYTNRGDYIAYFWVVYLLVRDPESDYVDELTQLSIDY